MAEVESEEAVRLRNKASEMQLKGPSSIAYSKSKEHKSSYFFTQSLAEMMNEDPIRLQNQSCVIREEIVKNRYDEQFTVYSSLARLPTFSIGLSSTQDETPSQAPPHESSVDAKDKSPPRYFQMPELGARVFVGDRDGFDTIACHLFDEPYHASKFHLDSEYAAVRSLYEDDRRGGLVKFCRSENHSHVILSGTELFVRPFGHGPGEIMVGNLGGKSSSAFGSSSDYKDCIGNETIRQPSDTVEQPRDPVPGVSYCSIGRWTSIEGPGLLRSTKGSYLGKPNFMKMKYRHLKHNPLQGEALQLTRFDDFVILGNIQFDLYFPPDEIMEIVRKNASETADVFAAQLVKAAIEKRNSRSTLGPTTAIVIFLDHKEILLREKKENRATKYKAILLGLLGLKGISQSTILKDDKKIAEMKEEEKLIISKEEEKLTISKEEEKIFASKKEDKKGITMEEDQKVKILGGEPLPNDPQISTISIKENELGMKSITISSNMTNAKMQDDSEASSSVVLIDDNDCKSQDFMVSCHITKWIIHEDLLERTLLCFFNIEEMQYEFYFEDHESMAAIIGLGVLHSKVILEYGSPHVTVVEISKENWDVVWVHSNGIPRSILEGYDVKQERFPDILHRIANVINTDNIVSKANNGGVGGDNGKSKAQGKTNNSKGKGKAAHDHDNYGNTSHSDEGSNGGRNNNDNNERKGKDGNDDKKDGPDRDDGKTLNDCKEVQAVVHLRFLPGGILEDKGKNKELRKIHEEEVGGKKNEFGEIHEEEVGGKKNEFGEVYEEEVEEKRKELGEGCKGVKKKKKNLKALWRALKRGGNGNVNGNQQKSTTIKGVENGDVDENLQKQLENQIHSEMVFTFTIKDEAGGLLKTIQATIRYIEFQLPSNNEENYLQRRRFGWFHKKLQVAFGVVNTQVAILDAKSRKVLDSSEVEEVSSWGNSKGNACTTSNAYKGRAGGSLVGVTGFAECTRTNGSEAKTTEEVHNSWKTNIRVTEGDFFISDRTDLKSQQLKYRYRPRSPLKEEEFEVLNDDDRLKMYDLNPICQSQQVSCEGTWLPYDSKKLEAYKLEASRELGMTKTYKLLEIGEEKKQKGVLKVGKNQPLCFIQKLEKVVYLNHAMSHLTSSTAGVYRLRELDVQNNPSAFFTQGQDNEEFKWPSHDPLVDVMQYRNI